jgi:hypothetical protein
MQQLSLCLGKVMSNSKEILVSFQAKTNKIWHGPFGGRELELPVQG